MGIEIVGFATESDGEHMNTQPEALRLADWCDLGVDPYDKASAAELRRLHEVNQELVEALEKLARLGNAGQYGNSEGNTIAQAALAKARRT